MSDGIDKGVVLFVASYLADQKGRIEHQAKDQDDEEYDPENKQRDFTPVENYPTDVHRDRQGDETRAQRDEECYGFATTRPDTHGADCNSRLLDWITGF